MAFLYASKICLIIYDNLHNKKIKKLEGSKNVSHFQWLLKTPTQHQLWQKLLLNIKQVFQMYMNAPTHIHHHTYAHANTHKVEEKWRR